MKKIFVALSMVAFLAACDDSSSVSPASGNDEPVVKSSSSAGHELSSSRDNVAEPTESSSSSVDEQSSSSVTLINSSSSVKYVSSSSLVVPDGWSWDIPKEFRLNSEITYGTMTDERDGKTYKTVVIAPEGSGYSTEWMAENLNYYDDSNQFVKNKSWCYGESDDTGDDNCDVAGRLYKWGVVDVCPPGWAVPDKYEWKALFEAVGGQSVAGKILKSQTGWNNDGNGTDAFGFSALPGGSRDYGDQFFLDGYFAYFWSSTGTGGGSDAYYVSLSYYDDAAVLDINPKSYAYSIRCFWNSRNPR